MTHYWFIDIIKVQGFIHHCNVINIIIFACMIAYRYAMFTYPSRVFTYLSRAFTNPLGILFTYPSRVFISISGVIGKIPIGLYFIAGSYKMHFNRLHTYNGERRINSMCYRNTWAFVYFLLMLYNTSAEVCRTTGPTAYLILAKNNTPKTSLTFSLQ